jgi:hypothetical protein
VITLLAFGAFVLHSWRRDRRKRGESP